MFDNSSINQDSRSQYIRPTITRLRWSCWVRHWKANQGGNQGYCCHWKANAWIQRVDKNIIYGAIVAIVQIKAEVIEPIPVHLNGVQILEFVGARQ